MPSKDKQLAAQQLRDSLTSMHNARARSLNDAPLHERLLQLKHWQVKRLSDTYADLLVHSRYGPATEFFRNDLYGPKDFSQRDRDVERIYSLMVKIMPPSALQAVATALQLEALSEQLDLELTELLGDKLALQANLTAEQYAEAYRSTGRRRERERQIALISKLGNDLDRLVNVPLLSTSLKLMRQPAKVAGLATLHDFLDRGFSVFKRMAGATEFLAIVVQRETQIMEQIFAQHPGHSA